MNLCQLILLRMKPIIKFLLVSLVFFGAPSCQDPTLELVEKEVVASNPYQKVGEGHNQMLDKMAKHLLATTVSDRKLAANELENFFLALPEIKTSSSYRKLSRNILNNKSLNAQSAFKDSIVLAHYFEVIQISKKFNFEKPIQNILNELDLVEQKLLNLPNYDPNDSDFFYALVATSTAKASIVYWKNQHDDPNSDWRKLIARMQSAGTKSSSRGLPYWAQADIESAVGTALMSWELGPGVVPATIAGAALGSAITIIFVNFVWN
jgi:hypothetical protein